MLVNAKGITRTELLQASGSSQHRQTARGSLVESSDLSEYIALYLYIYIILLFEALASSSPVKSGIQGCW